MGVLEDGMSMEDSTWVGWCFDQGDDIMTVVAKL
jgi:hypothetical protein